MIIELVSQSDDSELKFNVDDGDRYVWLSIKSNDRTESIEVSYIELKSAVLALEQLIRK